MAGVGRARWSHRRMPRHVSSIFFDIFLLFSLLLCRFITPTLLQDQYFEPSHFQSKPCGPRNPSARKLFMGRCCHGQVKRDGITWRQGLSGSPSWRSWVVRQWRLRGVLWRICRLLRGRMRELEKQRARRAGPDTRDQTLLVYGSTGLLVVFCCIFGLN
jgi:hypothetical protein